MRVFWGSGTKPAGPGTGEWSGFPSALGIQSLLPLRHPVWKLLEVLVWRWEPGLQTWSLGWLFPRICSHSAPLEWSPGTGSSLGARGSGGTPIKFPG